jgi:hypothetical protein
VPGHYGPSGGGSSSRMTVGLPGLGLPGMPTNLTPEQKKEMEKLQGRLREINVKLDNLEKEAARVDALPRGHRERSPSPPPSKFSFLFGSVRISDGFEEASMNVAQLTHWNTKHSIFFFFFFLVLFFCFFVVTIIIETV